MIYHSWYSFHWPAEWRLEQAEYIHTRICSETKRRRNKITHAWTQSRRCSRQLRTANDWSHTSCFLWVSFCMYVYIILYLIKDCHFSCCTKADVPSYLLVPRVWLSLPYCPQRSFLRMSQGMSQGSKNTTNMIPLETRHAVDDKAGGKTCGSHGPREILIPSCRRASIEMYTKTIRRKQTRMSGALITALWSFLVIHTLRQRCYSVKAVSVGYVREGVSPVSPMY